MIIFFHGKSYVSVQSFALSPASDLSSTTNYTNNFRQTTYQDPVLRNIRIGLIISTSLGCYTSVIKS